MTAPPYSFRGGFLAKLDITETVPTQGDGIDKFGNCWANARTGGLQAANFGRPCFLMPNGSDTDLCVYINTADRNVTWRAGLAAAYVARRPAGVSIQYGQRQRPRELV